MASNSGAGRCVIVKKIVGAAFLRTVGAGLQFFMGIIVARLIGIEGAGLFYIGFSLASVLSVLTRLGMEFSILRNVAVLFHDRDFKGLGESAVAAIATCLAMSIPTGGVIWLSSDVLSDLVYGKPEVAVILRWTALAIPLLALTGLISEILKGLDRPFMGTLVQTTLMPLVNCTVLVGVWYFGHVSAATGSIGVVAGAGVAVLVGSWVWLSCSGQTADLAGRLSIDRVKTYLREAPSLLSVTMTGIIMHWIGSMILGVTASSADVGGFTTAMRSSIGISLLLASASTVVSRRFAVLNHTNDIDSLRDVSQRLSLVLTATSAPFIVILLFFPRWVMWLFGPAFDGYAFLLPILAVGQIASALIGHAGTVLVMARLDRLAHLTAAGALLTSVLGNLILIPIFGVSGAAMAVAASLTMGHLLSVIFVRRHFGFWPIFGAGKR